MAAHGFSESNNHCGRMSDILKSTATSMTIPSAPLADQLHDLLQLLKSTRKCLSTTESNTSNTSSSSISPDTLDRIHEALRWLVQERVVRNDDVRVRFVAAKCLRHAVEIVKLQCDRDLIKEKDKDKEKEKERKDTDKEKDKEREKKEGSGSKIKAKAKEAVNEDEESGEGKTKAKTETWMGKAKDSGKRRTRKKKKSNEAKKKKKKKTSPSSSDATTTTMTKSEPNHLAEATGSMSSVERERANLRAPLNGTTRNGMLGRPISPRGKPRLQRTISLTIDRQLESSFARGGEMGTRIREFDWQSANLAPISEWPQPIKSAVAIMACNSFPMIISLGSEFVCLYNDAYIPLLGAKHPLALGASFQKIWVELWDLIGPMFNRVVTTGESIWFPDGLCLTDKGRGFTEEGYYRFSYSPIYLEDGTVCGVVTTVLDTTKNIIDQRRQRLLTEQASILLRADSVVEVLEQAAQFIRHKCGLDIPFANLLVLEEQGTRLRLVHSVGQGNNADLWPAVIDLTDTQNGTLGDRLREALGSGKAVEMDLEGSGIGACHVWNEAPKRCMILPMVQKGHEDMAAVFIAGLSPHQSVDEEYVGFLHLVANQIAIARTNARAREDERNRAQLLADLDQAKTAFFSNISHEFRTPLTLIIGPLQDLLRREQVNDSAREQLELMLRNTLRLHKIVNSLLDFSRLGAGRVNARLQATDLPTLTQDLVTIFRSAAAKANIELTFERKELGRKVYVDREMWEKIVMNLLSNALKYTLQGSIHISLQPNGDYVRLQVRDTGVGIPPDALPKVFQRFYRVEQTAGRSHEGTGIGLALVSELVKLHGGSVGAESELGKGSSFYVEIPFGQQSPMVTQPEPEKQEEEALEDMKYERSAEWWLSNLELERVSEDEKPEEAASPLASSSHLVPRIGLVKDEQGAHSKAWILLVEDNSDMRSYVTRLLKERFRVMEAANGRQALTMMDKHKDKIELVLSDVMMPHLDGFALLRHLRSHKDTETLPVVLLSARAGEEARVEGLAAGADAYLVKPFSATELLTVVDSTLRLARMRLQAAQKEQELRVEADAAKAQMEATLASIRDAFASVDNDLRFTFANDTAMKLLCGANADELRKYVIGQPVESWIPDSRDCRQLRRHIRRAISKGEEIHFESWMETLGCWLEHRIYPGAHGGASVLSKDITARKKAQERLAILAKAGELLAGSVEVEQILTNMVSLPVGGFARGCIIDAFLGNEGKMRRLMSANAQAASWLPDRDEEKRTFGEDWRLSETVQMRGEEVRFMTCLPPDSYVALPLTARGVTFGVWLFVLRENTEDDLTVARELARLTSQSVDNIRLLIETEKANRAKDHFLAALSHELRTPLTPVLLAAEGLAEEECLSLEVRNLVKLIRESIGLEVQLIDDLLDLTKVSRGKLQLHTRTVDVHELLTRTLHLVRDEITNKGLLLRTEVCADKSVLVGDPARLQQVMWNIVKNAIKFTERGFITIRTSNIVSTLAEVSEEGGAQQEVKMIRIEIEDTGIGIEPQVIPLLFRAFEQGGHNITARFGGLGMGLAISKTLVDLHHGHLTVRSEGKCKGSTFTIDLPVLEEEGCTATHSGDEEEDGAADKNRRSSIDPDGSDNKLRVLLVEDNKSTVMILSRLLRQRLGLTVTVAMSVGDALKAAEAEQGQFHLVISDVGLPDGSGHDLVRQLKAKYAVRAIALSGYGMEEDIRKSKEAGFDLHLTKPIDFKALSSAIRRVALRSLPTAPPQATIAGP